MQVRFLDPGGVAAARISSIYVDPKTAQFRGYHVVFVFDAECTPGNWVR